MNKYTLRNNISNRNVLVVSPHPDDIEIGMGATIHLMSSKDINVSELVLSSGVKSNHPNEDSRRISECLESAKVLGINTLYIDDVPDCDFRNSNNKIFESIDNVISDFKPQTIFLPWKDDIDLDHIETSIIGTRASRFINNVVFYQSLYSKNFEPTFFIDLTNKEYRNKILSLECYKSQVEWGTISIEKLLTKDNNTALNLRHHRLVSNILKMRNILQKDLYSESFVIDRIDSTFPF